MGNEFGQFIEWDFKKPLDWFLLDYPAHAAMQEFSCALNWFYRGTPALHREDEGWQGFRWLSADDCENSVIAFARTNGSDTVAAVLTFAEGAFGIQAEYRRIGRGAWDSKEQGRRSRVRMRVFNTYARRGDCSG